MVAPNGDPGPAQQAVEAALYQAAGIPLIDTANGTGTNDSAVHHNDGPELGIGLPGPAPGSAVQIAAQRFAALSDAERHAWLATHLNQLASGQITTLGELP
jgi:hypothetical protein